MLTISYHDVEDKSDWGDGAWQREPDKMQWPDERTGMPCMMVRGPSGSWCGYVGVLPGHPAYGQPYQDIDVSVHGGLTFSDVCADTSRAAWRRARAMKQKMVLEAARFPKGDAARWLTRWRGCWRSYAEWRARAHAITICHVAEPGEPDCVWWLGFDMAHLGDLMPGVKALLDSMPWRAGKGLAYPGGPEEVYRDVAYVKAQCAGLAKQLSRIKVTVLPKLEGEHG